MTNQFIKKKIKVKGHTRRDPRSKKRVNVRSYQRNQRFRDYGSISKTRAQILFNQRSQRARTMDLKTTSKKVFENPNEKWSENIDKSDVKGIDTKQLSWEKDWKTAENIQRTMEAARDPKKKVFISQVQNFALEQQHPVSDLQFRNSTLRYAFPSYKEYVEQWTYKKLGIPHREKAPRKKCSRCGKLFDKRILTDGKCPTCYWEHIHAMALMGASPSQIDKESSRFRRQLAFYIRKKNTPQTVRLVEIDIWTNDLDRFEEDFSKMNDVKMDETQIINQGDEQGKRYAIFYRNFGGKLKYPKQTYYQLNNSWET